MDTASSSTSPAPHHSPPPEKPGQHLPSDGQPLDIGGLKQTLQLEMADMRTLLADLLREAPVMDDDIWLVRYLLNPKYTVEKSASRFRSMHEARQTHGLGAVAHELITKKMTPLQFPNCQPVFTSMPELVYACRDRFGQPVGVARIGMSDLKLFLNTVTHDQFWRFAIHRAEYMRLIVDGLARQTGKLVQWVSVVDVSGIAMRHLNRTAFTAIGKVTAMLDSLYKECLGRIFVVNAPALFQVLWKSGKSFVNPRTAEKVMVLGADFAQTLSKFMDVSDLPEYLGGSTGKKEPDPTIADILGTSSIVIGGKVVIQPSNTSVEVAVVSTGTGENPAEPVVAPRADLTDSRVRSRNSAGAHDRASHDNDDNGSSTDGDQQQQQQQHDNDDDDDDDDDDGNAATLTTNNQSTVAPPQNKPEAITTAGREASAAVSTHTANDASALAFTYAVRPFQPIRRLVVGGAHTNVCGLRSVSESHKVPPELFAFALPARGLFRETTDC